MAFERSASTKPASSSDAAAQVCPTEVGLLQVRAVEASPPQIGVGELGACADDLSEVLPGLVLTREALTAYVLRGEIFPPARNGEGGTNIEEKRRTGND
eukprot:CAMPEP_0173201098 /NCGR_PEP_ID=MMETSP1141-20130122/18159_1 /TAXON_ID=483371 /ORGANISM="non described non described, Strain CCMP2298" /LENGTH=98 /DNA_ID=CAMNT_0014126175 /DNA_START=162 /DNA_END=457 /DNA_ORIENTATION=+